jgi:hypothetical protein
MEALARCFVSCLLISLISGAKVHPSISDLARSWGRHARERKRGGGEGGGGGGGGGGR